MRGAVVGPPSVFERDDATTPCVQDRGQQADVGQVQRAAPEYLGGQPRRCRNSAISQWANRAYSCCQSRSLTERRNICSRIVRGVSPWSSASTQTVATRRCSTKPASVRATCSARSNAHTVCSASGAGPRSRIASNNGVGSKLSQSTSDRVSRPDRLDSASCCPEPATAFDGPTSHGFGRVPPGY